MIKCENLRKVYNLKKGKGYVALDKVSLQIQKGEFVSVIGPSGCGKSTLLHILGFLDKPTSGKYLFNGTNVTGFNDKLLSNLRREKIGFVFQSFNLLPRLSALENIRLPMIYKGTSKKESMLKAARLIERVRLSGKEKQSALEMSGGEKQRVSIARAMANNPDLILADEPTGNLDSKSGGEIIEVLKNLNASGLTIIMVTHDLNLAGQTSKILEMKDGKFKEGGLI